MHNDSNNSSQELREVVMRKSLRMIKIVPVRIVMVAYFAVFSAWGKSLSLDLRLPAASSAVALKAASAAIDPDSIRRVDLEAGSADVGAVSVGDELALTLFDDVSITLTLKKKMPAPIGGDAFLAEVSGYDGVKNAVVLRTADGLTIDIHDFRNKKIYKVISSRTGVIVQEAESRGVGCGCDAIEPFKPSTGAAPAKADSVGKSYDVHADPDTTVDILVAYDSNAKEWAMANGGITNFALVSVQKMNTVLANNNLDSSFRFRLVGVVSVPVHSYNLNYALESAANGAPGWEGISAMRDEVGADIVTVLIDTGTAYGTTGLGFSLYKNDYYSDFSWFEDMAYNACLIRSVAVSHTMTHEVGHNMGCGHSDIQISSPGPQLYDYSAGYYFTADGENYYTVMAYGTDGPGGEEAPYFSSPSQYYKGVAVGDSNHDNRRTLYNTYIDASQWRAAKSGEITTGEGDLPPSDPLTWQTTRAAAMSQAKAEGKKVFLISGRDMCWNTQTTKNSSCEVFAVKSILYKNYVCWYNNCDDQEEESRGYFSGYDIGSMLPFIAVIDPTSDATLAAEGGYHDSDDLLVMLRGVEPPVAYTLKLHRNYASDDDVIVDRSMTYGKALVLPRIETDLKWAPRTDYSFVGWAKAADATRAEYADGESVKNLTLIQDATVHLYGVWRKSSGPSPFVFGGAADWTQEADGSWRSGEIFDNERTSASLAVTGPGNIFFLHRTSSEYQYDELHFYVDGREIGGPFSGETDWGSLSYDVTTSGSVTLKWEYVKDDSDYSGDDCVWIKDVTWTPGSTPEPEPTPTPTPTPVGVPELYDEMGAIAGEVPGLASEYNGYLGDANGNVAGSIQVKVGKPDAKTGLASVKATVQIGATKKSLKAANGGKAVIAEDGPTTIQFVGGETCVITFGAEGLLGSYGSYEVDGARNFFTSKVRAEQGAADAVLSSWLGPVNVVWSGSAFTVTLAKKGKAKVKGTMADGTKVSANAVFLVGEDWCCVPVVAPKAGLSFCLWLSYDGKTAVAEGLSGEVLVGRAGALGENAMFHVSTTAALWNQIPGAVLTDYLPDGVKVTQNGARWVLPRAGKVALRNGEIDEAKLLDNPAGLKLSYKAADGSFKGSFKVYAEANGRLKATTVNVAGVMIDGVGYGTATIKGKGSVAIEVR